MFSFLRRRGSRPVRRTATVFVRPDPKTGVGHWIPIEEQETHLSAEGSPDTVRTEYAQFWDCGHSVHHAPLGGQCTCGRLSCTECHGQCANPGCRRPLCPACSYAAEDPCCPGDCFCRSCHEKSVRGRVIKGALRFLVRPFVIDERSERRGT
jgi:hypothetical protein